MSLLVSTMNEWDLGDNLYFSKYCFKEYGLGMAKIEIKAGFALISQSWMFSLSNF